MSDTLPPGMAKRYRVQRFLGKGAAGKVFRCHDAELDRQVAIKLLEGASIVASSSRFFAEAQALSQLKHPNILEMYDHGAEDEVAYLVLEYVDGGSLADLVGEDVPPTRLVEIMGKVLDALAHAHSRKVLHRDVKPENVLLDGAGEPKLADFGLAKHSKRTLRTRTGIMVGTPEYMAPEIFEGKPVGPPADLYSWGCLLYVMSEGKLLHEGELKEIVRRVRIMELPPEADRSPFRKVFRRALEPDATRRADHRELRELLRDWKRTPRPTVASAAAQPIAREAPTRMAGHGEVAVPTRSFRRPLALGLGSLLLFSLLAGFLSPGAPPADPAPPPGDTAGPSLMERWRDRLSRFDIPGAVQSLHGPVYGRPPPDKETYDAPGDETQRYPGGERHQYVMARERLGEAKQEGEIELSLATADLEALDRLLPGLPFVQEFRRDRDEVIRFLRDRERPFSERLALYRLVQKLAYLDAYADAWGRPRPYVVKPVLDELAPVAVAERFPSAKRIFTIDNARTFARPEVSETPLGENPLPGPGRHLLYHWALHRERSLPFIVQDPRRLSKHQRIVMAVLNFINFEIGKELDDLFGSVRVRLNLGPAPVSRYRRLLLRIVGGNVLQPDGLRIDFNDLRILFHPPSGLSDRRIYIITPTPEFDLEVELPPETWREGENNLTIRMISLPGLNHRQGADVYSVHLVAEARGDL